MPRQFDLFGATEEPARSGPDLPAGFRYRPDLITPREEATLLTQVRALPSRDFEFHGYTHGNA
jgi:hypothetical protein